MPTANNNTKKGDPMEGLLPICVGCHDRTWRTVPRRDGTLRPRHACTEDLEAAYALLEAYAEDEEETRYAPLSHL